MYSVYYTPRRKVAFLVDKCSALSKVFMTQWIAVAQTHVEKKRCTSYGHIITGCSGR